MSSTEDVDVILPDIGAPLLASDGKSIHHTYYYLLMAIVLRLGGEGGVGLITSAFIDDTAPSDGDLLIGNTTAAKYQKGVISPSSSRISIGYSNPNITINAIEANFTLDNIGGILSLSKGGSSKALTASNGGIVYTDADSMEVLSGTATARQMLQSGSSAAPAWSTTTWPATSTVNRILYSSATNVVGEITSAANSVLVTDGSSVPSLSTDIPTAVTIGSSYIYRAGGTDVPLLDGGTNASLTASNGGIVYSTASAMAILSGVAEANRVLLSGSSAAPAWSTDTLTLTGDASLSGTNTGDQTITLTGDVTGSGTGSFAATIANDAVTYAKIQNVSATDRLLGRSTAGAGDVEEITCTAAGRAIIDDANATAQRTTLGLGTIATQDSNSVSITGGSITGITDLAVADGGTGASTAGAARTNIGLNTNLPFFRAYLSSAASNQTGDGTLYQVICDTEVVDQGSGYNNSTGVFTAPEDGYYIMMFYCSFVDIGVLHTSLHLDIVANSVTYRGAYINPANLVEVASGAFDRNLVWSGFLSATQTVTFHAFVSGSTKTVDINAGAAQPTFVMGWRVG